MNSYPALENLAQGFLYEDWPFQYSNEVMLAVDDFARSQAELGPALLAEIVKILASTPNEEAVAAIVKECDPTYEPSLDGFTYREWLVAVAARVEKVMGEDAGQQAGSAAGDDG
jgi:hypothetical protein